MKVVITIKHDPESLPSWPQVIVESQHPEVICTISERRKSEGIDFVKGACLHAIGDYEHVPDVVEFKVVTKEKAK